MTSLLLALVLSASPQTFLVHLEPSSVFMSWQGAIVEAAVAEVRASPGRQAFTPEDERRTPARFVMSLNVAQFATSAVATVKVSEVADGRIIRSDKVAIPQVTRELCVAEVRKLVKRQLDAIPLDLPVPELPRKK